jgi:hypothetical protein
MSKTEIFWLELIRYIEWSDGFCLIFLFSPKSNIANEFRERLANRFSDAIEQPKYLSKQDLVLQIIIWLRELQETSKVTNAPIWVELDRDIKTQKIFNLLARINERRELLRNRLHRPLIFILPSGYQQLVREIAPDLWSIRDYTFNLSDLEQTDEPVTDSAFINKYNILKTFSFKMESTFNVEQVEQFIHNWYLANNKRRYEARDAADDLLVRLGSLPTLNEFTSDPLLLKMIVIVHRYQRILPKSRVELYRDACNVLLEYQQKTLTSIEKRVILQELAAQMMKNKTHDINVDVEIKNLNDIQETTGLLLKNDIDVWRFAHFNFQAYFAATYFLEKQTKLDWNNIVNDSWWHEFTSICRRPR